MRSRIRILENRYRGPLRPVGGFSKCKEGEDGGLGYSDTVWMSNADVVWSYADEISMFLMLLMDRERDAMLSVGYHVRIELQPPRCCWTWEVPCLKQHPQVRELSSHWSWEAIESIDVLGIWIYPICLSLMSMIVKKNEASLTAISEVKILHQPQKGILEAAL